MSNSTKKEEWTGQIDKFLSEMKSKDLIYEKDGATWFRSTSLGKDQDRVYIKSSGEPTYRVPDTVYHQDKINSVYNLINTNLKLKE
jgi:arginyl-tRNA synthetase